MAIKCITGEGLITAAVSGSVTTGTSPTYDLSGSYDSTGGYYRGTDIRTYSGKIVSVTITSNSANVQYAITGEKTVQFFYVSSISGKTQSFSANVIYEPAPVIVEDVVAASGSTVDYLNTTKDTTKYMWTRPTAFDLQLPWSYIASWSLSRAGWGTATSNSMCVDSTAGVVASSLVYASPTSGTGVFTIPKTAGIRYGDYLTLTLTPKPCATLSQSTFYCKVARGNTAIKQTAIATGKNFNTEVDTNGLITAAITKATWGLSSSGAQSLLDSGLPSGCENINITITKSASIKDLEITVGLYEFMAQCWYAKKSKGGYASLDYSAIVYYGGSKVSTTSSTYTTLGKVAAGSTSATFTISIKSDERNANVNWPAYLNCGLQYKITAGTHCYTTSVADDAVSGGQLNQSGDGGGSGGNWPAGS